MWSMIKYVLGLIPGLAGMFNAREATTQAHIYGQAQVGQGLTRVMEAEVTSRSSLQQTYAINGFTVLTYLMAIPFLVVAYTVVIYWVFIWYDTLWPQPWNVASFPEPFDSTVNQVLLGVGGVSGAGALMGLHSLIRR